MIDAGLRIEDGRAVTSPNFAESLFRLGIIKIKPEQNSHVVPIEYIRINLVLYLTERPPPRMIDELAYA